MSKAAELAALIANVNKGSSLAAKNFVINGNCSVNQRGSISMAHDGTTESYGVDRFNFRMQNADELDGTLSQATDAPTGTGLTTSLKWTTGTAESAIASNEIVDVHQKIEAQNLQSLDFGSSDAKPIALSFYVKSSQTGTFAFNLYEEDDNRNIGGTYTISSADTWEYKSFSFAGDTGGTIDNNNGAGIWVVFALAAGSDYKGTDNTTGWATTPNTRFHHGHAQDGVITTASATWQITGVQLEIGEKATEFEHEPFETTLLKCQRYLQRWEGTTSVSPYLADGRAHSTALCITPFQFMTQFRNPPSISINGAYTYDGTSQTVSSVSLNGPMPTSTGINWTVSSGLTQHRVTQVYLLDTSNVPYMELEAEL